MQNQLYSGLPSIILPNRPFYSIIVPCYNSRNTLGNLLDSILQQNMNDDLEVILSDDCSTESYQDIVDKYNGSYFTKYQNNIFTTYITLNIGEN